MQVVFEKIVDKLEELKKAEIEREDLCDEEGFGDGEEIYEDGKSQGRFEQVVRIIEIVKQEAEKYNNGWIQCSSGVIPKANGWYLVTNHLGVVQEQRWSANHWEKLRDDAVLAWRELPSPYQPKGE